VKMIMSKAHLSDHKLIRSDVPQKDICDNGTAKNMCRDNLETLCSVSVVRRGSQWQAC
jgi:5-methylcytosine-specific restriction endonuclease McrA